MGALPSDLWPLWTEQPGWLTEEHSGALAQFEINLLAMGSVQQGPSAVLDLTIRPLLVILEEREVSAVKSTVLFCMDHFWSEVARF